MNNRLKQIAREYLLWSKWFYICYIIVYIIICFTQWDIYNPFQWILDLPTMAGESRLVIISLYTMYQGIKFFVIRERCA